MPVTQTSPPVLHRRRPLWQRLLLLSLLAGGGFVFVLVILGFTIAGLSQLPWFQEWAISQSISLASTKSGEPPATPRAPYAPLVPEPTPASLARPSDLFVATNVWTVHLRFSSNEWAAIQPTSIPRTPGWFSANGTPRLNNTNAPRPGLAGAVGVAQPWSKTYFEFGHPSPVAFSNVAVRFKGNGTFLFSRDGFSRPYKLDLSKGFPGRHFARQSELNLHNMTADKSFVHDALGYEFYRDAGVPAPRTTYARVFHSLEDRWDRRLLGLYVVVEDPGDAWLAEALSSPGGALFKPVTPDLFLDLGDSWGPYDAVYNPKSTLTDAHKTLIMGLCHLVTHADDAEFARRLSEFFDLGHLCRFLACEALISNYDGIFTNGQNFLLWIDPRNLRLGLSPWDLDQSWGQFDQVGSTEDRIRVSLFHPWVGSHRFFERVFAVAEFQSRYRAELTRIVDTVFIPERLNARLNQLAAAIRPAVAELPKDRSDEFEKAVASPTATLHSGKDENRKNHSSDGGSRALMTFIQRRAAEARSQLEGRSEGVVISREPPRKR